MLKKEGEGKTLVPDCKLPQVIFEIGIYYTKENDKFEANLTKLRPLAKCYEQLISFPPISSSPPHPSLHQK